MPGRCAVDGAEAGPEAAFERCCRSVELNSPGSLPAECTAMDLQPYAELPDPVPVPLEEGF